MTEDSCKGFAFAIFCTDNEISAKYVPLFVQGGAVVIDNSSFFRKNQDIPLIAYGVNHKILTKKEKIIANPNCSTISAVNILSPVKRIWGLKRVVYTTLQAVSGAGKEGISALNLKENYSGDFFEYPIYGNCIAKIGECDKDGYTTEENKLIFETKKILQDQDIAVTATAVRVPVKNGHSISVNAQTKKPFTIEELKEVFSKEDNLITFSQQDQCPVVFDAVGSDKVFVGRIRRDFSVENGFNAWIVSDNLLRGAASNALEILKYLIDFKG